MPASRFGGLSGLLGNFDGDPDDDVATRNGRLVPLHDDGRCGDFDAIYHVFGNSWRISQAESLFDYEPGKSTATYQKRDFPGRCATPADLPPNTRKEAEQRCRAAGATKEPFFSACVLDVGLTGDPGLADSSADIQAVQRDYTVKQTVEFTTFDGLRYPLNVIGDYVFTRSTDRKLEVDVRLAVDRSVPGAVAFTGIGALVGGDRVSVLAGEEPVIRVNGHRVPAARLPLNLRGGARIDRTGSVYSLVWPNDATLRVNASGRRFEHLTLSNVPRSVGRLEGLLGDADGDSTNDLKTEDGTIIPQPATPNDVYRNRLNRIFAASWQVFGSQSLIPSR